MNNSSKMRDPDGSLERYADFFRMDDYLQKSAQERFKTLTLEQQVHSSCNRAHRFQEKVLHQYGRGDLLGTIKDTILAGLNELCEQQDYIRARGRRELHPLYATTALIYDHGVIRDIYAFVALIFLLDETGECSMQLQTMLTPAADISTSYLLHLLITAFIPDFELVKKYKTDKYRAPWTDPILRALAQSGEWRAPALGAHMKNWQRLMRPYGWKPKLDLRRGHDNLFCDFAFEVALAVCAYDIDDSSFAAHPYYPRDLVEYYRKHVRGTRDAWRPETAGVRTAIIAPPLPKKADLAKSKRKNFARWVELICDGDVDATESVFEEVGKPRKVNDLQEVLEALVGQVIQADIKDDETLELQASGIAVSRGLEEFEAAPGPPFGAARCIAMLSAFAPWLSRRGYRLVSFDDNDDSWNAVAVKAEHFSELLALSAQLGIATCDPNDVCDV
jgi:hypothetical protein